MKRYAVMYQEFVAIGNQVFVCEAQNESDAKRQCQQTYPNAEIRSVTLLEE